MYIKKVTIENIRSIEKFEMEFEQPAGWHVIIGDNGSGKSTMLKLIGFFLIGNYELFSLRQNWMTWATGETALVKVNFSNNKLNRSIAFPKISDGEYAFTDFIDQFSNKNLNGLDDLVSVGLGPFRRFDGFDQKIDTYDSFPRLSAHITLYEERIGLTEIIPWLQHLKFQTLENKSNSNVLLSNIEVLMNSKGFLPNGLKLKSISSEGVYFLNEKSNTIEINDLSDGFRSILSLTLEIVRQLSIQANIEIFEEKEDLLFIKQSGIVLIDEIDAHLHPTWQTRIGQWFTKYFPNIQFIVTTHSPLICRAAEKGTIWRLATPGTDQQSGEVTGTDRDRLVYGNVLDAYGTEVFGEGISISKESDKKLTKLAELNVKSLFGSVDVDEEKEMKDLKSFFPSDSTLLKND